jgi:hypothetical protein
MKRFLTLSFISIFFLGLSGCMPSFEDYEYDVKHSEVNRIESFYKSDEVPFFYNILFTASVVKFSTNKIDGFAIQVYYKGKSWLFLDGYITIQTEQGIIKIRDNKPSRTILSDGNVQEIVFAIIDKNDLLTIANAKAMRIEFCVKPFSVDKKGISFIKRFYNQFK